MFNGCKELKELDVSNFDTANVLDMRFMFCGCKTLIKLNLGNFCINDKCFVRWMFSDTSQSLKDMVKEQNKKISNLGFEDYLIE